jgi:exodeoxyribonuclease VII large subunit
MIGESPTFTVSQFVAVFNQSLEMLYPEIIIAGEISNFRVSKGKWVYFDLKDEYSSVRFFGTVFSLPGPLDDGMTCEVIGRPRLHNQFGFSISFDSIRPVGEGSIRKAQDLLLKKLEAEGLFAPERKRRLPYPPQRIGLITSAESAAIADFRKIIAARWPRLEIELIDTLVQGSQAPEAIRSAIQAFNMASDPPELLVIIRGGGSADDLAAFSEESVVRSVAASRLPTMVAIGHENDVSLAELVADVRASTPSNAAELLVPDAAHERVVIANAGITLRQSISTVVQVAGQLLRTQSEDMNRLLEGRLKLEAHELNNYRLMLRAVDPVLPMQRGFALVRDGGGKQVKSAQALAGSDRFSLEFTDGKIEAQAVDNV